MDLNDFLITKEYLKFEEFCNACFRDKYIGICYGVAGIGKTMSAMYYSKQHHFDTFDYVDSSNEECLEAAKKIALCKTVYYTATVTNTPKRIKMGIEKARFDMFSTTYQAQRLLEVREKYRDDNYDMLLIIDEADRLKWQTLEQIRDMYDQRGNWGIVLIGMNGIEKRLARYPQLYSRIGFAHHYQPINKNEVSAIIELHWKRLGLPSTPKDGIDEEGITLITRITNGNFRIIKRLFSQVKRIMEVNELTTVDKDVIEAARDCLVIGAI